MTQQQGIGIADVMTIMNEEFSSNSTSTNKQSSTVHTATTIESNGVCTSPVCRERIGSLEQLLHEYQKALEMKQKECEIISESMVSVSLSNSTLLSNRISFYVD